MTCFHPIKAYRSRAKSSTGGYGITFNPVNALIEGSSISLPCGKCLGCRIAKSREWAMRCTHEAKMHKHNAFVTLTYDDDKMPEDGSVHVRELQLFMKKLRKHYPQRIRFFGCGEYGGLTHRPHYHALLFNHHFSDQQILKIKNNNPLYTSASLQNLWPYGFSTIGQVNYQTAAYTARYTIKKINGEQALDHYTRPHCVTGKIVKVEPEFITMSRMPGIGTTWLEQYKSDCYPSDFLIVDGKKHPIPKFYDNILKKEAEADLQKLKRLRKIQSNKNRADNTPARLAVREDCLQARIDRAPRKLEEFK